MYANDTFINERLVRGGLAFVKLRAGQGRFAEQLLDAQAQAVAEGRGMWTTLRPADSPPVVGQPTRAAFHRPDCRELSDPPLPTVRLNGSQETLAQGMAPCGKCRPCG